MPYLSFKRIVVIRMKYYIGQFVYFVLGGNHKNGYIASKPSTLYGTEIYYLIQTGQTYYAIREIDIITPISEMKEQIDKLLLVV